MSRPQHRVEGSVQKKQEREIHLAIEAFPEKSKWKRKAASPAKGNKNYGTFA